jgi:hypothetical protein
MILYGLCRVLLVATRDALGKIGRGLCYIQGLKKRTNRRPGLFGRVDTGKL